MYCWKPKSFAQFQYTSLNLNDAVNSGVFSPTTYRSWGLKENMVHSLTCFKIIRAGMLGINSPGHSAAGCAGWPPALPHGSTLLGLRQKPTACCTTCWKCNRASFLKRDLSLVLRSSSVKAFSFKWSGAIVWPYYLVQVSESLLEMSSMRGHEAEVSRKTYMWNLV